MKGLSVSVEEKAARYDAAIERAKNTIEANQTIPDIVECVESLFPELKESEDERIRKDIVTYLKSILSNKKYGDKFIEDWIAWLEKQGEHANFINKIQIGDKVTRNEDGVLVNISQLKRVAKPAEEYNITGIGSKHAQGKLGEMIKRKLEMEKQGEQKPEVDQHSLPVSDDSSLPTFDESIYHPCTEKVYEQNPTDEVKPKFNVGDIVKHKTNPYLTYVLKRFTDDGNYEFHAIGKDGTEGETCFAVVEYQDEWELVEQKPTKNKGMNLDEEAMTPFQKKVFCIIDTTIEEEQGLKQVCDELLRLAHDEIMQNTAWSEEDEARFESCIKVLQTSDGYDTLNAKWFKSLKDRVFPQLKQEWSEDEQVDALIKK